MSRLTQSRYAARSCSISWRPWVGTLRAVSTRESVRPSAGTIACRRANRQGGAGAKLRPAGPAGIGLASGLGLVESAHGRRHGGVVDHGGGRLRPPRDLDHRVAERVERLPRLRLRRLAPERLFDDWPEV